MKIGVAALLFVFLSVAVFGAAQQPAPPPQQAAPQNGSKDGPKTDGAQKSDIIVISNLVNVLFTVTDKKGRLIPGLKQDDFRVFENGILQSVSGFSSEPDPPLSIALLIDTSGSIRDKLKFEQDAAGDFFQYTLIRRKDKGTVISFDSGVDLLTREFTDDPGELREALLKVRAGGGTSMFDAVYLAVKGDDHWKGLAGEQGRRVIVLISDGDDNFSRTKLPEVLETLQLSDVVVYAISTNSNFFLGAATPNDGDKNLRKLADETGGQVFLPEREKDLLESFDRIKQDLRSLYTIGYKPSNEVADGTFRKIRIDVTGKKDYKDFRVNHRKGYYAPNSASDN
ncbi:MAG TPA: VWA domain-containing protein [Terriglobia bacterium]|nr:VWA domain-containing protein [Terriglobia bacterium]